MPKRENKEYLRSQGLTPKIADLIYGEALHEDGQTQYVEEPGFVPNSSRVSYDPGAKANVVSGTGKAPNETQGRSKA